LFLLHLAYRRHQEDGQHPHYPGRIALSESAGGISPTIITKAGSARAASSGQDVEASRALIQVLLAAETLDRLVSWQDVADQTGLSRSRAYALLREERTQLVAGNGHQPTLDGTAS
jgi:hypothetical protein